MRKLFLIICFGLSLYISSCNSNETDNPQVVIKTGMGDITVELFADKAPRTVASFLQLVEAGHYNGGSFYRVIKNENLSDEYNRGLIQGGIYKTKNELIPSLPFIPHESPSVTGISHIDGTLSMARTDTGTAKSEFFICIGDQTKYDSSKATNPDGLGMAAFGRVKKGMDVVRKIQGRPSFGENFEEELEIREINNY